MSPTTTGTFQNTINFYMPDMPLAASKMFDYDDYKISNIQLVITPLRISNGAEKLEVADSGEPYFYVLPRIHPENWTTTYTLQNIKSTPGVMRFSLLRRTPIVINLKPIVPVENTLATSASGATQTVESPFKYLGWVHNPQEQGPIQISNYPNYGHCGVWMPQLVAGSFIPRFKFEYYATCTFRGNRALLDV